MTDPYIYPNGVLINKLNEKSYEKLNQIEADIGFVKLINIDSIDITSFDENLLKAIHKHIFEDIFSWAGEFRTVPIVKEEIVLPRYSIPYTDYKNISKDLHDQLNELNSIAWQNMDTKEISLLFARKMALLWKVHPFRDGNTRTMLCFAYLYGKEHGFPFDIRTFATELNRRYTDDGKISKFNVRDKFVLACLDEKDYPEVEHLALIFEKAISNFQEYKNNNTKK